MIKFNNPDSLFWRNFISRSILVLIVVTLIVLFLPRSQNRMYHYDEGKPWVYGQLIAKFDFPIFKTEETLKHERDSIMQHFIPYYNADASVANKKIEEFRNKYQSGILGLSTDYVDHVASRLQQLYDAGIVSSTQSKSLRKDTNNVIHVVTGKQAITKSAANVYTTLEAYEQIFADPQLAVNRTILQQCNLNEYIEPNLK